jgi:uncharacterized membrane protein/protein-disulfide isomerase
MIEDQKLPGKISPTASQKDRWMIPARMLLGIAAAGSAYLAWNAFRNGPLAGCGPGSGCDQVLHSRWAYWFHLPVSAPAVVLYLGLLAFTIPARKRGSFDEERGAWAAIIALSVVVAGAALWFIGLQVFVIKAFCEFCLTVHLCGLLAAFLCLKNIPLAGQPNTPMWAASPEKQGVPRKGLFSLILIGLAGVVFLAGGQWLVPEHRNVVKLVGAPLPVATAKQPVPTASTTSPNSPNAHLSGPRLLSLYNGKFILRLDELPMIGSPAATNVIVSLFDYTCPHCREMHWILLETQRHFSNQLAIVSLPMPMSTNCNHFIPANFNFKANACEFAHLGLAVWRAKPEAYRQYDDWFFAADPDMSFEEARKFAAQLVGEENLTKAMADSWLDKQIETDCQIHFANWQATGRPSMPQLIIGSAVSIGPLDSVEHLQALLSRYLGLDPGQNRF